LFSSLGVQVSVIEMMPEILGNMDRETSALLRAEYAKKGVTFYMQARVTAIDNQTVHFTHEEQEKQITADKILVSVGRKARTNNLEALPLEMAKRGVAVNEHMQTNLANVYAAGDITGYSMLAHTAVCEAEVAVSNIAGEEACMSYNAIPGVVYTCPEVAGVGVTEEMAQANAINYAVAKLPMTFSGRFVAENEGVNGLCKVVYDVDSDKVLGVHMFGNPASEIINMAALAIEQGLTVKQWRNIVVGHPTVSEIIKETLWSV
jgi:dihydrolipoamide dehydrogenase